MSGTGVPEGFTLPWNTTVTMADAEDRKRAMRKALDERNKALRAELRRQADEAAGFSRTKIPYAGQDK